MALKVKRNLIQFSCIRQNPYIFIGNIYLEHERKDKIVHFMIQVKLILVNELVGNDFLTRIENIKKVDENGNLIKDASCSFINRYLIPEFSKIVFAIESQFSSKLNEEINNNQTKLNDLKKGFSIDLSKKYNIINENLNLTPNEINKILNNSENIESLYKTTIIKKLQIFSYEWKKNIKYDKKELIFQDLLFKNKSLFPFLFGINNILGIKISEQNIENEQNIEREKILKQDLKENRVDIWNEDFLIELKRPSTKLFSASKNNSRNNISGISSSFASAINQIKLYVWKNDREKEVNDKKGISFTKGILIIGLNKEFIDDIAKTNSYKLILQNEKIQIYTFDEISNIADYIIKEFKKINF